MHSHGVSGNAVDDSGAEDVYFRRLESLRRELAGAAAEAAPQIAELHLLLKQLGSASPRDIAAVAGRAHQAAGRVAAFARVLADNL
ncbi:MAG TPA: hypothetical protein VFP50_09450 [Anaeromyxobacteraceae bacterium]|nr:hypothetical protein [Anaeromyxobacteraceae bacterium]